MCARSGHGVHAASILGLFRLQTQTKQRSHLLQMKWVAPMNTPDFIWLPKSRYFNSWSNTNVKGNFQMSRNMTVEMFWRTLRSLQIRAERDKKKETGAWKVRAGAAFQVIRPRGEVSLQTRQQQTDRHQNRAVHERYGIDASKTSISPCLTFSYHIQFLTGDASFRQQVSKESGKTESVHKHTVDIGFAFVHQRHPKKFYSLRRDVIWAENMRLTKFSQFTPNHVVLLMLATFKICHKYTVFMVFLCFPILEEE